MKIVTHEKKIDEILTRGVDTIYPSKKALSDALGTGKQMTIYNGVDPTAAELHIGHLVVLRKLEQFRRLGHKVILLIGGFTARIGDPTDKLHARKTLTAAQVAAHAKGYRAQIGRVLSFDDKENPAVVRDNAEWWDRMSAGALLSVASHFTKDQLAVRDMFREREKKGAPVFVHEFLYPVLQGYDSVALDVDAEVGGTDQTFNMLTGRTLMMKMKGKEKFVLTAPLLADPSGWKIGKTEGNAIPLTAPPEDLYGKIMTFPDSVSRVCFETLTDVSADSIAVLCKGNPRDAKMRLAREVVAMLHGATVAKKAEKSFVRTFQKRETPEKIANCKLQIANLSVVELLVKCKLAKSKSEARRVVEQGGVKVDGKTVEDPTAMISISKAGVLIQKGKRHFVRVLT